MQFCEEEEMKYENAPDLQERMVNIVNSLNMDHVDTNRVTCLRSRGSSTKRTIARCHALGKVMQKAMKVPAYYAIEFLEIFERMNMEEQDRVIIHELMHIPKTFGGGFRQHDYVCEENIDALHSKFKALKRGFEKRSEPRIVVSDTPKPASQWWRFSRDRFI